MAELLISNFVDRIFEETIFDFRDMPMQIGFFKPKHFFEYDHQGLVKLCKELNISIKSVHAPTIDIFQEEDFFRMLDVISTNYGVDNITIHPGSENPFTAYKFFEKHEQRIADTGISLLYENFDSSKNKKWLPSAKSIFMAPIENIFLTYDTSHIRVGTDIVKELKEFLPRLGMVHLSNKTQRKNHLPIFDGDHDLKPVIEYLRTIPLYVALEYHNEHDKLLNDYRYLVKFFS